MSVLTAPAPPQQPRGRVLDPIRRRPLLSFVVLALTLSWVAWIPYILSNHGLGLWDVTFPGDPGGQLVGMLPGAYLGPIGSALLVTAIADGRPGLRAWARRLWRWRVGWVWYAAVLTTVPVAMLLSAALLSGGEVHAPATAALVALVPNLLVQMVTTGLAEEPGWRDFALPRAQRRFGPVRAAVLVGLVWGVWHLPLHLTVWAGWPDVPWFRPLEFIVFCVVFNVVMTWVFNRTGQSLPMAMMLHVSVNNTASTLWESMFPAMDRDQLQRSLILAAGVAAVVLLVRTRGRLGYVPDEEAPDGADREALDAPTAPAEESVLAPAGGTAGRLSSSPLS